MFSDATILVIVNVWQYRDERSLQNSNPLVFEIEHYDIKTK